MTGAMHAIAVSDAQGLHLVARVARRPSGIYYLLPRDAKAFQIESDKNWDPHVSYHADGWHHIKSFGQLALTRVKRQALNSSFSGAEPLVHLITCRIKHPHKTRAGAPTPRAPCPVFWLVGIIRG